MPLVRQEPGMNRVLVIGPCGAGKSTTAVELGGVLGLPVHHLDQLHWREGWLESSREELLEALAPIMASERWLIDGNYGGTMATRIERADTVVYLDYPTWLCLWRALRRVLRFRGRTRPDMAPGCPERFDLEFFRYILTFRNGPRVRTEERLIGHEAKVRRFRRPAALERWMDSLRLQAA
jgi:adenylate kinase family enzyme